MGKGAIFDVDGTILDSMEIWDKAAEMFLNSIGIDAQQGLSKELVAMSMVEGAQYLKSKYALNMDVPEIVEGVNDTIEEFYYYRVQLKEGVVECLKKLAQSNIKMVVATSSDRRIVEKALTRLNVIDFFERIFTCTEVGIGKTEPNIYLEAAKYMGTKPEETWVFEDASYALETAKKAGFKTIGVWDKSNRLDLKEIKCVSDLFLKRIDDFNYAME